MEQLGFDGKKVKMEFEKIDIANVKNLGFSRKRFPKSMSDTYRALCFEEGRPISEAAVERFVDIALSTFGKKPRFFPGTVDVLRKLSKWNLKLILATKGDPEVQREKMVNLNLNHYFNRIYVFTEKGEQEFVQIVNECSINPALSWSIGNSIRSDVNPALKIGMKAIWLERRSWSYELEQPVDRERLFRAKSMKEVINILKKQMIR
jgi:putative hydrolase of the HAD superfamily